ncbi:MAG TPA: hypothetical protein VK689_03705 [Armatimonadota bacterium]|nr:hypothetical protein [Armatimonadota bacterium]
MIRSWENPVARHAGRLASGRSWPWAVLLLLLGAGALGILLQKHWLEMDEYSFLRPRLGTRWLGLTLVAETVIALPWAAVRGALLWRRLREEGHLEEYRRSRMSASAITLGMLSAALYPVLVLLCLSLAMSLGLALSTRGLLFGEVVAAHLLLAAQALAFGALGLWLTGKVRYPALAIPAAVAVLGSAMGAIWALDPFYRRLEEPERWIYWALLPNPVTAVGNALNTDVLRFGWIYERLHAHEYFFVYPAAWQTGGFYVGLSALLLILVSLRVSRAE